jgi:hypothetical protein
MIAVAAATAAARIIVIRESLEIPLKQTGKGKGQEKNKE